MHMTYEEKLKSAGWISVKDAMPESMHDRVLFLVNGKEVKYGRHGIKGWWMFAPLNGFILIGNQKVSYWRDLP